MSRNHRKRTDNAPQKGVPKKPSHARNAVRIVGGIWRGRRIRFPEGHDIRPSPDRVRETLFNWLAPHIRGARCLDLFAGSGVLGLEAISRGAASAVLVDRDPVIVRHLQRLAAELAPADLSVVRGDAMRWLSGPPRPFDIVFLDPPFGAGLLPGLLGLLARPGWLTPGALVYLEFAAAEGEPVLPAGWRLHRSGRAGEVGYHLAVAPAGPEAMPSEEGEAGPTRAGR